MKKYLFLIVVVVLFSCKKEDDKDSNVSVIVGMWAQDAPNSVGERSVYIFNEDLTGTYYNYVNGVKSTPVNFNYNFDEKIWELSVMWINMPHWSNSTDLVEIRNENVLIYQNDTFYRQD